MLIHTWDAFKEHRVFSYALGNEMVSVLSSIRQWLCLPAEEMPDAHSLQIACNWQGVQRGGPHHHKVWRQEWFRGGGGDWEELGAGARFRWLYGSVLLNCCYSFSSSLFSSPVRTAPPPSPLAGSTYYLLDIVLNKLFKLLLFHLIDFFSQHSWRLTLDLARDICLAKVGIGS